MCRRAKKQRGTGARHIAGVVKSAGRLVVTRAAHWKGVCVWSKIGGVWKLRHAPTLCFPICALSILRCVLKVCFKICVEKYIFDYDDVKASL